MIRTAAWKYVFSSGRRDLWSYETGYGPPGRQERLYDLRADPHEFRNLGSAIEQRRRLQQFRADLREIFIRTDPRSPAMPGGLTVAETLEWFLEPPDGPRH